MSAGLMMWIELEVFDDSVDSVEGGTDSADSVEMIRFV